MHVVGETRVPTASYETAAASTAYELLSLCPSVGMQRVLGTLRSIVNVDSTVLIEGETGVGKELVAKAIHALSPRRHKPLVAVNCGAISAGVVESELFGHVRGAFTGAMIQRDGYFRAAEGGTLFLDEIGELPLALQVKLLRVLQERVVQPVGSDRPRPIDVRIVAGTNAKLASAVEAGTFREDLYYRLEVFPICVPPLRERAADIPPLTRRFLDDASREFACPVMHLSHEVVAWMESYPWPGNIRQLENATKRAAIYANAEGRTEIELRDMADFLAVEVCRPRATNQDPLDPWWNDIVRNGESFAKVVRKLERGLAWRALELCGGNKEAAAQMLRMNRTTLAAQIRRN